MHTAKSTPTLERIEALDASIARILNGGHDSPKAHEQLMLHYAKRGSLSVDIGLAEAGLADLLRAYAQQGGRDPKVDAQDFETLHRAYPKSPAAAEALPFWLWSRLGEGFRRYALDVLLTRTERQEDVYQAIHRSIDCFKRAEVALRSGVVGGVQPSAAMSAWIVAHRAAARTTLFWMSISAAQPREDTLTDDIFKVADAEFARAVVLDPKYRWAKRFRAFLYAIRGRQGDFKFARTELEAIRLEDPATQSSLSRSIAMLASYDAVVSPGTTGSAPSALPEREQAAREALEGAMAAVAQDPEDFIASYFGAVATWILGDISHDEEAQKRYAKKTSAAVDGARARSLSIISQAYATLAGLELIAAMTQDPTATKTAQNAGSALHRLNEVAPDWETRAIFMRDPVWQTVKNDPRFSGIHGSHQELPNFDILREKYKVSPMAIDPEDAK